MERGNLNFDANGEATSGSTTRASVRMRSSEADCPVVVMKRGNARGAKRAGHSRHDQLGQLATGWTDWLRRRAAALNEWHEPCESRGSSTDLWAPRGEIPRGDSAVYWGLWRYRPV